MALDIKPRSAWDAVAPTSRSAWLRPNPVKLQVHWEGTRVGITTPAQVPLVIKATQRFHMESRDYADIAYNLIVDPFGTVWEGRGADVRSGANGTTLSNHENLAVCVLLGEGDPEPTDAVFTTLARLRDELALPLIAHGEVKATACPGHVIRPWVEANRVPRPAVTLTAADILKEPTVARLVKTASNDAVYLTDGVRSRHVDGSELESLFTLGLAPRTDWPVVPVVSEAFIANSVEV